MNANFENLTEEINRSCSECNKLNSEAKEEIGCSRSDVQNKFEEMNKKLDQIKDELVVRIKSTNSKIDQVQHDLEKSTVEMNGRVELEGNRLKNKETCMANLKLGYRKLKKEFRITSERLLI